MTGDGGADDSEDDSEAERDILERRSCIDGWVARRLRVAGRNWTEPRQSKARLFTTRLVHAIGVIHVLLRRPRLQQNNGKKPEGIRFSTNMKIGN